MEYFSPIYSGKIIPYLIPESKDLQLIEYI